MNDMKGKKVLVVGMGKSGIAATQAMVKLGANVAVQDSKPAEKIDQNLLAYFKNQNVDMYFDTLPGH